MKKLLTLCAAVMLLATGCNSEVTPLPDESSQSSSRTDEQTTGTVEERPEGDILIRVAVGDTVPMPLSTMISEFNQTDNGYQIQLVKYKSDDSEQTAAGGLETVDMDLQMDIVQGDAVDLVPDIAFNDKSTYVILAQKGAFVDLNTFLGDKLRAVLDSHILELHKMDGKLYQIPLFYSIETQFGYTEYVGTKENWTFDEMVEKWEAAKEDTRFISMPTRENVYKECIKRNMGTFVDYETMTCDFTSPDFIRFLDFCQQFPTTNPYFSDDTPYFMRLRVFNGINGMHNVICDENAVPCTLVGYPSSDGNGSFIDSTGERWSICTKAAPEVQEGAWLFLETLLSEEYQYEHDQLMADWINDGNLYEYGFPINTSAFQHKVEDAKKETLLFYEDIPLITQAECDHITDFIGSLSEMSAPIDGALQTIVDEEIEACLAGGQSGEDTARNIQSRVGVMLSEKS